MNINRNEKLYYELTNKIVYDLLNKIVDLGFIIKYDEVIPQVYSNILPLVQQTIQYPELYNTGRLSLDLKNEILLIVEKKVSEGILGIDELEKEIISQWNNLLNIVFKEDNIEDLDKLLDLKMEEDSVLLIDLLSPLSKYSKRCTLVYNLINETSLQGKISLKEKKVLTFNDLFLKSYVNNKIISSLS